MVPMKVAMGALAALATLGGLLQVPWVDSEVSKFLEPAFATSTLHLEPSTGLIAVGLALGTVLGLAGIYIAYRVWVLQPGTSARFQERFAFLHRLFANKWYFDELIELVVVRP